MFARACQSKPQREYMRRLTSVALRSVQVEDEDDAGALERNDAVALVLEADVGLGRSEPLVLVLERVHGAVKVAQVAVAQELIVG